MKADLQRRPPAWLQQVWPAFRWPTPGPHRPPPANQSAAPRPCRRWPPARSSAAARNARSGPRTGRVPTGPRRWWLSRISRSGVVNQGAAQAQLLLHAARQLARGSTQKVQPSAAGQCVDAAAAFALVMARTGAQRTAGSLPPTDLGTDSCPGLAACRQCGAQAAARCVRSAMSPPSTCTRPLHGTGAGHHDKRLDLPTHRGQSGPPCNQPARPDTRRAKPAWPRRQAQDVLQARHRGVRVSCLSVSLTGRLRTQLRARAFGVQPHPRHPAARF